MSASGQQAPARPHGRLAGKVAVITGAARGIGAGVAARLQRDGWRVVLADRNAEALESTTASLRAAHGAPDTIRGEPVDVSDEAAVARLLRGLHDREGRLDGLVCNAGFMIRKSLAALTLADWSAVLATNLTSSFLLVRAAESLLRTARGAVVTIASTRARMSEPNTESYAASKGGLVALTHALAISLGPEVRANVISPGWIDTRGEALRPEDHAQHPAGRVGRVEDVAGLAAWLLGPESGFVTGAEFVLDGGMTRKMIYAE